MTILYPAPAPVKTNRPFGKGLLASRPAYRYDHTASDEAWLIAVNARRENSHYDRLAEEAAALDRLESGLC